jgi:Family of unknown function (DUF6228)
MNDLTLVLESARISNGRLELTPVAHPQEPDSAERPTWHASLTADDLAVTLVAPESNEEERTLAEFFDWIFEGRQGWDGERAWQSASGALRMICVHDQINTVKLRVQLRGGVFPQWTVLAELHMDPGRFHRIGANAQLFFDRFRGAALEESF